MSRWKLVASSLLRRPRSLEASGLSSSCERACFVVRLLHLSQRVVLHDVQHAVGQVRPHLLPPKDVVVPLKLKPVHPGGGAQAVAHSIHAVHVGVGLPEERERLAKVVDQGGDPHVSNVRGVGGAGEPVQADRVVDLQAVDELRRVP